MSVGLVLPVGYFKCPNSGLGGGSLFGFGVDSGSWCVQPVEVIWAGLPWRRQ